ncbi:MAG: beta-phosphoglucomutase [Bdellovibrionales bacterium]|nr:beta-phosphoglucomutase [Bdellovibrionales bacterium]
MHHSGPSCIYQPSEWEVAETQFDPEFASRNESVFTIGNGFLGVRGFFEEGYYEEDLFGSVRSLYLNGYYDIAPIEYPESGYGYAKMHQAMVSVANPNSYEIAVDGEVVVVSPGAVSDFSRSLNFRNGILQRSFIWRAKSGARFRFTFNRFASFPRHHLLVNSLEIEALDSEAVVVLRSKVELTAEKIVDESDPRVGGGDSSMKAQLKEIQFVDGVLLLKQRTTRSYHSLAVASAHSVIQSGGDITNESFVVERLDLVVPELEYRFVVKPEALVRVEKLTSYHHSIESKDGDLKGLAIQDVLTAQKDGFTTLAEEQEEYLEKFWEECDVEIRGDTVLQQGIRFALFQLLQSVGRNGRSNVAAKGLTGEGYGGHYFWDTEIYVLPFFIWTKPEIAKALLQYRYSILNRARERAAELDHVGALYPWRTISGDEASSFFPAGTAQYHINADIAFAISKYVDVTGDRSLLAEFGAEMLFEIARFFVDLGSWIPGKGFCFHSVTGPDEYTACVDNNAYTNTMIQQALQSALEAKRVLEHEFPTDWNRLRRDLALHDAEFEEWQKCFEGIYVPFDKELGIIAQDDSFLSKPKWDFQGTPRTKYPLLLHYHYLNIYRHQVLKQADVLMLMYLMPEKYTQALTTRCFDYYEPLTTHDSSLSPAVHATLAANIGKADYAYEYFDRTSRLDLDDICGNTQDGLHIAALAGSWCTLFYGFLGVQIRSNTLRFRPSIPARWNIVRTRLQFRQREIEVVVTPERVEYRLLRGEPLQMMHYHDVVTLTDKPLSMKVSPYLRAVVFDLDGVVTDTAEYHFLAWKQLADELKVPFDREQNEALKGVSRMASLELILGERAAEFSEADKVELAEKKNAYYLASLDKLNEGAVLPGVLELLVELRKAGVKTAIASSSKNARFILGKLGIAELFDEIADGTEVMVSKPDPEVFLLAAKKLGVRPCNCVGVEDADAGIKAIIAAGMVSVGVSMSTQFTEANHHVGSLEGVTLQAFLDLYESPVKGVIGSSRGVASATSAVSSM